MAYLHTQYSGDCYTAFCPENTDRGLQYHRFSLFLLLSVLLTDFHEPILRASLILTVRSTQTFRVKTSVDAQVCTVCPGLSRNSAKSRCSIFSRICTPVIWASMTNNHWPIITVSYFLHPLHNSSERCLQDFLQDKCHTVFQCTLLCTENIRVYRLYHMVRVQFQELAG